MKLFSNLLNSFLTILRGSGKISQTRELSPSPIRELSKPITDSFCCPYCQSKNFKRRGFRQKKLEKVQLYQCLSCGKTFTQQITKGKHYPLAIVLDALSTYNLGYSLEQTCRIINEQHQKTRLSADSLTSKQIGTYSPDLSEKTLQQNNSHVKQYQLRPTQNSVYTMQIQPSTLANWITKFVDYCPFLRLRYFALKKFSAKNMVVTATLAHRQLYRYRFHQAKASLMIEEEYKHYRFKPLREFLEMVPMECPHQYFQKGLRASEAPLTFSKKQMIVRAKQNYATKICSFVLQSVKERKLRHEALQKFMLYNDSTTVATEVPVYLTRDDLEHLKTQLGFEIYQKNLKFEISNLKSISNDPNQNILNIKNYEDLPKLITGHIDILQIRNGQIHILDYKPNAEKERPIEQLTLYAMALSRLTGLRLFEFKCAWFDEKDYFEFYPLHVLHKLRKTRRRRVYTMEGVYKINKNDKKIERIRPI